MADAELETLFQMSGRRVVTTRACDRLQRNVRKSGLLSQHLRPVADDPESVAPGKVDSPAAATPV
jgi:hypothetical protein